MKNMEHEMRKYIDTFKQKLTESENLNISDVMVMLPSVDDAGVIAVNVASNVRPKLTVQEESFFIAGFQECVKYLRGQVKATNHNFCVYGTLPTIT